MAEHVADEQRLPERLSPADRVEPDRLLRALLGHLGPDAGSGPRAVGPAR